MLGGARLDVGGRDAERAHVGVHRGGVLQRDRGGGSPLGVAAADDLVVDVGDVADEADRRSPLARRWRMITSNATSMRAWPTWHRSYGVMPQA